MIIVDLEYDSFVIVIIIIVYVLCRVFLKRCSSYVVVIVIFVIVFKYY